MLARALAAALVLLPLSARADDGARPLMLRLGAGAYVDVTGPSSWGPAASLELYPGTALGRFGLRASWRGHGGVNAGFAALGLAYEAAAARPRLQASLWAELGAAYADVAPVAGGGFAFHLRALGPLQLSAFAGAHVIWRGLDSELSLAGGLSVSVGNLLAER